MPISIVLTFVIGYLLIAFEHPLKIDKAAIAILTGVISWILVIFYQKTLFPGSIEASFINESLLHHVGEIAEILFFLMGAMTIVELIDAHNGFDTVTNKIVTTDRVKLVWILSGLTFFFSALLDNLTTSIVMAVLLRKLISDKEDLWFMAGMVVIAANAGGAWSPIGDVTTIMLWIGGQVSALNIVTELIIPSLVCILVPLSIVSFQLTGNVKKAENLENHNNNNNHSVSYFEQNLILAMGLVGLLFVPVFKQLTQLPPFMGILFSLGILWIATEIIHRKKESEHKNFLSVATVIQRIDTPSILFFLGILLAVSSLETAGFLQTLALALDKTFGNLYVINTIIGLLSALVDNVPLVAGAIGMYPTSIYPQDHTFWELLAYSVGTGGSTLIIGSAAGVAIMGILKIDFLWYLRKISLLALAGYFAGIGAYWLLNS